MKGIAKSVARQTGQLAKSVAKQTLKDIGEIPKSAPRQAVGQPRAPTTAKKQKLVTLPSFEAVDVKKEIVKVPETAAKQVSGSVITESLQGAGGKIPQVSEEEEKRLEKVRVERLKNIDAEMEKYRQARKKREREILQTGFTKEEQIVKPAEPIQLPASPPKGPRGPVTKKGPEIRKSKH